MNIYTALTDVQGSTAQQGISSNRDYFLFRNQCACNSDELENLCFLHHVCHHHAGLCLVCSGQVKENSFVILTYNSTTLHCSFETL